MNKKIVTISLVALLAGAVFYAFFYARASPQEVIIEAKKTDQIIQSMDETTRKATARVKSLDTKTKKHVEVTKYETKKRIWALPADRVAVELDALLSEWRAEQEQ